MPNQYFQFKQFKVTQEKAAMKVGVDGVLLGAWANGANKRTILDVGTGTGLIALMLAQQSSALIDALEIDFEAAQEAQFNVNSSPWGDRITIINESFQQYAKRCAKKYDLIVSNPPYFSDSLKTPDLLRNLARHTDELKPEELFTEANLLLAQTGSLEVIYPAENFAVLNELAKKNSLYCNRILWVFPKPNVKAKRVLISFTRNQQPILESEIVIESNGRHHYSEAYKDLTRDFYLAF